MKFAEPNIRESIFSVSSQWDGWRLDQFLAHKLKRLSRNKARKICKEGDIEIIPARPPKPALILHTGDRVILREHLPDEDVQYDQIQIFYEDEHLLVINKPVGMLVHESANTRLNTVDAWLKWAGYPCAEAVHRIDRETSGCLVCAKTREAIACMRRLFACNHPQKIYRCRVLDPLGRWNVGDHAILQTPLGLVQYPNGETGVRMGYGDLPAKTIVDVLSEGVLENFGRYLDLQVRIETGRQHQIRAHLSFEGTPIAGDKLYTYDDQFFSAITDHPTPELYAKLPYPHHCLHAYSIAFKHPFSKKMVVVKIPYSL